MPPPLLRTKARLVMQGRWTFMQTQRLGGCCSAVCCWSSLMPWRPSWPWLTGQPTTRNLCCRGRSKGAGPTCCWLPSCVSPLICFAHSTAHACRRSLSQCNQRIACEHCQTCHTKPSHLMQSAVIVEQLGQTSVQALIVFTVLAGNSVRPPTKSLGSTPWRKLPWQLPEMAPSLKCSFCANGIPTAWSLGC